MQQRQEIKRYILQNFLFADDDSSLGDQDALIAGGIIDSTGIIELIEFLEERFRIAVAPEEMVPANFHTIESVDGFVSRKLAS